MARLAGVKNFFILFASKLRHAGEFSCRLHSQLLNHKPGKFTAMLSGAANVNKMVASRLFEH